jgi:hypothetical protein
MYCGASGDRIAPRLSPMANKTRLSRAISKQALSCNVFVPDHERERGGNGRGNGQGDGPTSSSSPTASGLVGTAGFGLLACIAESEEGRISSGHQSFRDFGLSRRAPRHRRAHICGFVGRLTWGALSALVISTDY